MISYWLSAFYGGLSCNICLWVVCVCEFMQAENLLLDAKMNIKIAGEFWLLCAYKKSRHWYVLY